MNRNRINLILGVLLFPVTDPKLQVKDYLYDYCCAYRELIELKGTSAVMLAKKAQKNKKYREAGEKLIQYLADSCRSHICSLDDLYMLCELYYPLLGMERDIRKIQEKIKQPNGVYSDEKENTALFYMERMRRIALSLLTYRDGIMAIRTWNNRETAGEKDIFYSNHVFDKVEIWNMLNSYVSPDLFMALFIVESELSEEALFGQKPYISLPDKLLDKILRKGMAENHLHFNAGFDYEAVWLNKMNLWNCLFMSEEKADLDTLQDIAASVFRLLVAIYFITEEKNLFIPWAETFYDAKFFPLVEVLYTGEKREINIPSLQEYVWRVLDEEIVRSRADYLMETVLIPKIELKTSSEFILLYYSCRYIKEKPWDTGFAIIFLQYIRIKNAFIQKVQQSNLIPGLKHFQKFFNQMKQEEMRAAGREIMMLDAFRAQSKIVGLKKLEIRIAPDVKLERLDRLNDEKSIEEIKRNLCRQLFEIFRLYLKYILENIVGVQKAESYLNYRGEMTYARNFYRKLIEEILKDYGERINTVEIPTLGIVYHFIKSESIDNISGYYCWRNEKRGSNHSSLLREKIALLGIAIEDLRIEIPRISEYIVGIDAASDENAMEPWMFSLAYKYIRSKRITRPIAIERAGGMKSYYTIKNIGFTYHVGEDYRHIVSGLRHIDEVVEQFYYKPGDRLGHALALGQDIRSWIQETESVAMPVREYMENLLWIWGKSISGEVDLPVQLEMLEEKILLCAEKIYKNLSGITVRVLYQVYERKFLSGHKELLMELIEEEGDIDDVSNRNYWRKSDIPRTYCKMINANCPEYGRLWTEKRLLSTYYCPVFEERARQVEMVPVRENEAALYESLQEYLLKKIARKGIYIETNPTSNLNIGNIKEVLEHPIFRMSPLRPIAEKEQNILVTVNSDDPAVFNTNVENELAYVYYALEHAGCTKEDVLHWIDKIRQNGMDGSFISKVKECRTLLEEIGDILDLLESSC